MALFVTYDEEGGFLDHLVPPTPPQTPAQSLSTVATTNEIFPGDADHPAGPYGLGIRVPMIIVSPWTPGRPGQLPAVRSHLDDPLPRSPLRARQGRPGRVEMRSADPAQDHRSYTVEPGKQLNDTWDAAPGTSSRCTGPTGFWRHFRGGVGDQAARLDIGTRYGRRLEIALEIENRGTQPVEVTVADRYSPGSSTLSLKPGGTGTARWSLGRTRGCTTWSSPSTATPASSTGLPATWRTAIQHQRPRHGRPALTSPPAFLRRPTTPARSIGPRRPPTTARGRSRPWPAPSASRTEIPPFRSVQGTPAERPMAGFCRIVTLGLGGRLATH